VYRIEPDIERERVVFEGPPRLELTAGQALELASTLTHAAHTLKLRESVKRLTAASSRPADPPGPPADG
jgi:hypothetical protein